MSTQLPLRIARSSLHRQCLFQRRTPSLAPSTRAFSSTPPRPRRKENRLVDIRMQLASAESVVMGQSAPNVQASEMQGVQEMVEDIGLLQNTVIRARMSKLPSPASWELYSYLWTLVKSKFTGMYTRSHFKRCVVKKGIRSYLPVDFLQQGELKKRAKSFYRSYYESLAAYVSLLHPSISFNTQVRSDIGDKVMLTRPIAATPSPSSASASLPSPPRCAARLPPAAP